MNSYTFEKHDNVATKTRSDAAAPTWHGGTPNGTPFDTASWLIPGRNCLHCPHNLNLCCCCRFTYSKDITGDRNSEKDHVIMAMPSYGVVCHPEASTSYSLPLCKI